MKWRAAVVVVMAIVTFTQSVQVHAECSSPDVPNNGYLADGFDGGADSYIKYACREGYRLEGSEENYCGATEWLLETPKCIASSQCPEVGDVENAENVYRERAPGGGERDYGATVEVICRSAYLREPDVRKSECKPTGKWEPPVPKCVVPMCLIPDGEGLDVHIEPWYPKSEDGTRVQQGSDATVSCKENYKVKTGRPGEIQCVQIEEGLLGWDTQPPECEEITCDPIDQPSDHVTIEISPTEGVRPDNGRVTIGTEITFRCVSDVYKLEGSETVTCNKYGTEARYSSSFPSCRALACSLPGPPLIVTVPPGSEVTTNKVIARTVVQFSCAEHHKLNGSQEAECSISETFNSTPTCIEMLCQVSSLGWGTKRHIPPDRMVGEDKVLVNTTVTFSCSTIHNLKGEVEDGEANVSIVCIDSHTWDTYPPECEVKDPVLASASAGVGVGVGFLLGILVAYCVKKCRRPVERGSTEKGQRMIHGSVHHPHHSDHALLELDRGPEGQRGRGDSLSR